jgi:hypothetical protein
MLPDRVMRGKESPELQARHGVLSGCHFLFVGAVKLRAEASERNHAMSRAAECRHACFFTSELKERSNLTSEVIAALRMV